eukprot:CAMPEP_0113936016 /NCGR_PEP_ID=MMETSP1339-20121228/3025_1 /TAXON_ID=94617 /ORGANISM="Fibrocapsa japonica" /LENGTH=112 /DNA_ID=CAMNT_0000938343 /DNA_START=87 /DNA_END=425 /DNA_ORIENTATION=+ /assembly_acc=CAM_ASM_000762
MGSAPSNTFDATWEMDGKTKEDIGKAVVEVTAAHKSWAGKLESADPAADEWVWKGTHTTKLCKYVDDVTLTIKDGSVSGHSASRVGKEDFGQNKKNLKQLQQMVLDYKPQSS